jgi:hypothetical protein
LTQNRWYILVAGVFTLHNTEEALGAPAMLRQLQSQAPRFLRSFYSQVDVSDLRFGLAVLTLLGIALAAIAIRTSRATGSAYAMLVFGTVIGINAFAHIVLSVIFRAYMPGLLTAIFLCLPVAIALWYRVWKDAWIPRTWLWTVVPAALLVHGPLLAGFIRTISV